MRFELTPADIGRHPGEVAALAEAKDLKTLCAQVIEPTTPRRVVTSAAVIGSFCFELPLMPETRASRRAQY